MKFLSRIWTFFKRRSVLFHNGWRNLGSAAMTDGVLILPQKWLETATDEEFEEETGINLKDYFE